MSESDEPESSKASGVPDPKSDEEERYRLKIIALEEYYSAVQLQTFRLRERIYNVRKQCRRLEGMKRATLNLLRYYTGTYDIPPLEIVDEDPVPSFLESLQKQQVATSETPRKKSKRPTRGKLDGKLTAEEEERAKQKICSIIDSVYSETARRMGDVPRRPIRNLFAETPINSDNVPKKGLKGGKDTDVKKVAEGNVKVDKRNTDMENLDDEDNRSDVTNMQLSGHSETISLENGEQDTKEVTSYNDSALNHSHDPAFKRSCTPTHPMVCSGEVDTSQSTSYHNMTTSLFNGVPEYTGSIHQLKGVTYDMNLINNSFSALLDGVQPMDCSDTSCTNESNNFFSNNGQLFVSCNSLSEVIENAAIYTNAENYADSSASTETLNYNENVNSLNVLDYAAVLNTVQKMNDAVLSRPEPNYPAHPNTTVNYENVVTTLADIVNVNEVVSSEVVGAEEPENVEQARMETPPVVTKQTEGVQVKVDKQEMQKSSSSDKTSSFPLPNFIPYRMITVENPKPVEIITVDSSGGEVPPSKQLPPRRRRKYKYVVESVLDNVPYTFRQAESDDDESNDRNSSTTTKTSLNLN